MIDKTTSMDVFRDVKIDGKPLYENSLDMHQLVKQKMEKNILTSTYRKFKLILGMKILQGSLYLKVMLKLIEVAKKLFVYDMEQGGEVYIMSELSQESVPMSLRYYDPILKIVQEDCCAVRNDIFLIQNEFTMKEIAHDDLTK